MITIGKLLALRFTASLCLLASTALLGLSLLSGEGRPLVWGVVLLLTAIEYLVTDKLYDKAVEDAIALEEEGGFFIAKWNYKEKRFVEIRADKKIYEAAKQILVMRAQEEERKDNGL